MNIYETRALLQPGEVAALLHRSLQTLRRWQRKGYGPPHVLVAGRVMYRSGDVAAWVANLSGDVAE